MAGPASLVPHPCRMRCAPISSQARPHTPPRPPSVLCSEVRVALPSLRPLSAPHTGSRFAGLTLTWEASLTSSGVRSCLFPRQASPLPATGPARVLTSLCSHPLHPLCYTHILRVCPFHPVSPSRRALGPALPTPNVRCNVG